MYLAGFAAIMFVIYVWRAPLDWVTDFLSGELQDSVNDLRTTTTTSVP